MRKLLSMIRLAAPAVLALGTALGAQAAHAGGVQWSIGINLPAPGVVIYPVAQVVAYGPAPVYVQPQPVYMQPQPVYQPPQQVVYVQPEWHRHHHWHEEHERGRWDDRGDDRWGDGRDGGRHGR